MNTILDFFTHLSIQDICGIIGAISSISVLIPQHKKVNNDAYIIVHPHNFNSQPDTLGCAIRTFFYVIFVVSMILLIPLIINIPIDSPFSISSPAISSPTILPLTEQAKLTIQMFYDDINKKDYQSAYYLTKDGFGQSYQTFVNGFYHTKHDKISFGESKELSDTDMQVTITLQAIENCSIGERTNTYYIMYRLLFDHGGFIILNGKSIKNSTYPPYC